MAQFVSRPLQVAPSQGLLLGRRLEGTFGTGPLVMQRFYGGPWLINPFIGGADRLPLRLRSRPVVPLLARTVAASWRSRMVATALPPCSVSLQSLDPWDTQTPVRCCDPSLTSLWPCPCRVPASRTVVAMGATHASTVWRAEPFRPQITRCVLPLLLPCQHQHSYYTQRSPSHSLLHI